MLTDLNPREEQNFSEFYSDLDEFSTLPVKVAAWNPTDPALQAYKTNQHQRDAETLASLKRPCFRKIRNANTDDELIDRNYLRLGYHNLHSAREGRRTLQTYARSDDRKYGLVKGDLRYGAPFQVQYDMDENDLLFLQHVNSVRDAANLPHVSKECFEVVISFLENESFFIEQLLPPPSTDHDAIMQRQILKASLFGSDDGKGVSPEEDQCCAVCNRNECDSSNAIVFCDGCNIAVHQDCYGIPFIPEGPWLCRRCLISRDQSQRCLFCPSTTGAFKQTDNGYWAHVICTLWVNELYFANPIYMEPIEGIQDIPKSRWRLTCYICKKKIGACVQCCHSNCFAAYHVTCARRSELYLKMNNDVKGAMDDQNSLVTYCDKHTPKDWAETHDTEMGIERTRLYYSLGMVDHNGIYVSEDKRKELTDTRADLFRWRTHRDAPVVPNALVTSLQQFLKLKDSHSFLLEACKYWTLKREVSHGPLIKRPDPTNYSSLTSSEIKQRFKVLKFLKDDVANLQDIAVSIRGRESDEAQLNDEIITEKEISHFPELYGVDSVAKALLRLDRTNTLATIHGSVPTGPELLDKIGRHQYNLDTLIADIESIHDWVISNETKSSPAYKLFRSWGRSKQARYKEARLMR